jgi:hypothetical protein
MILLLGCNSFLCAVVLVVEWDTFVNGWRNRKNKRINESLLLKRNFAFSDERDGSAFIKNVSTGSPLKDSESVTHKFITYQLGSLFVSKIGIFAN